MTTAACVDNLSRQRFFPCVQPPAGGEISAYIAGCRPKFAAQPMRRPETFSSSIMLSPIDFDSAP